ncbi:ABC transporter ATP-binding protein [Paenibacillus sp. MMS20-IR301]|uniref:ABC transporter ATP-binding protein n=1 Tax=Paenibacillus sp. MMS20-IR301 TaxID=2895946 RepID=UPI0028E20493|nr:ABC transporter ATP-binding protein [Paenibacillus sp. MMS20-IR301]WNS40731.1 ABC transporter ATP-binding protein [Paenibacillus sp. MMS20-IR301]
MQVLQCNQVFKSIKGKAILKDFTFSIQAGEIVGLVGPNGAGKTTLMRLITGLSRASGGSISIKTMNIEQQFAGYIKEVGAIIETPLFYPYLTGYQCLNYYAKLRRVSQERLHAVVQLLGLSEAIHKKVKAYSLGMRQRLGLAQAVLAEPSLLILDEPFNGLDPSGVAELRETLKNMAGAGTAVFLSSHTLNELEAICDRAILMNQGELLQIKELGADTSEGLVNMSVATTDDTQALALIKKHFGAVQIRQEHTLILSGTRPDTFADILLMLREHNIKVVQMKEERNSLENTFMTLIGGKP